MKLCVMGLGYIGLPTAVMFAKHGVKVHGVDVNEKVVKMLQDKELHIEEPGLIEMMIEVIDAGNLTFATKPEEADAYIIAVPTPIKADKTANLDYVASATEMILPYVKSGNLVILESTVPPRTVEDIMLPILEKSGLEVGKEIFVSHSPERVMPGKLFEELVSNDRIVGGINEKSSRLTVDLYKKFVKGTIHVTDSTTAEMVKLMENTYRDVNIAFANELARIAEEIGFNVWEAIDLANCHPRVNIHKPGPGVGGHCIAVDPWFIIEQAPVESRLISMSRDINETTPLHVADRVYDIVKDHTLPVVTILGLAFKGNIDDMRESPSLPILHQLRNKDIEVRVYDPLVKQEMDGKYSNLEEAAEESDCLVILTDHEQFKSINLEALQKKMRNTVIYDTRNIFNEEQVESKGFTLIRVGS
ncbi:MAG: nucleotide sugar dehydrogenase [Bacillaceae bacterium]|nr:nucleotide sugar dehydrogenase [Bacillaceae bacterium]